MEAIGPAGAVWFAVLSMQSMPGSRYAHPNRGPGNILHSMRMCGQECPWVVCPQSQHISITFQAAGIVLVLSVDWCLGNCIASTPSYKENCNLQLSLWLFLLIDNFYSLQIVEVNVSVTVIVLKYIWHRSTKLQLLLILIIHSCVFWSYIKSTVKIVSVVEQNRWNIQN